MFRNSILALVAATALAAPALAAELTPAETARIDAAAERVLAKTGVPSASIALVKDGRIAYVKAYGLADLETKRPATPEMRYAIGSISKEFTAAAILVLAEEGKLKLDDPVGKYVPGLTDGDRITIRQALSHTSGYRDFWPQDYVFPDMRKPATPDEILARWAKTPLDFKPGDEWQYSNTGYVLAGLIIEKVSGEPLMKFLHEHVLDPLHMTSAVDFDNGRMTPGDAHPYTRYALGPARPAPDEAKGWMFGAGELAMTPHDLALWDISEIDRSLLKPQSYKEQSTGYVLNSGQDSGYGLGLFVGEKNGRRAYWHGGEVSGFITLNRIYPDDRAAIVVLGNGDFGDATSAIADGIADVLFPEADQTAVARSLYDELRTGHLDRSKLSPNGDDYFSPQVVADFRASLEPLGEPTGVRRTSFTMRGGMTSEVYEIDTPMRKLRLIMRVLPDGKVEQYMISPVAG